MHRGSAAYDAMEQPQRTSAGSAAPEPYQILMPVQMADGQMTALPPDQAQVGAILCNHHLWQIICEYHTEQKPRIAMICNLLKRSSMAPMSTPGHLLP